MVKETNTRIIITVSKDQAAWLKKTAKKMKMSISRLCKWLMDKNIAKLASFLTKKEWEELKRIAKTPWIRFNEEN